MASSDPKLAHLSAKIQAALPVGLGFSACAVVDLPALDAVSETPRQREFRAGRAAARAALAAIGGPADAPLAAVRHGPPAWPEGWNGSISHTKGLAVAVAGSSARFPALGLDFEHFGRLRERTIPVVCHPAEVAALPAGQEQCAASRLFSLKEAFYKAQYPSYQAEPRFHDLALRVDTLHGSAAAHALDGVLATQLADFAHRAHYRFWESGHLVCALVYQINLTDKYA